MEMDAEAVRIRVEDPSELRSFLFSSSGMPQGVRRRIVLEVVSPDLSFMGFIREFILRNMDSTIIVYHVRPRGNQNGAP